jgi:hypothetical protein
MKDSKSSFGMYEELLMQESDAENKYDHNQNSIYSKRMDKYFDGDEDSEEFVTSAEIVKNKKEVEERRSGLTSDDDGIIEESVHFQRFTKRREHKYTEKEMMDIRNSCHRTIVHDYGTYDIYHISNEERAKNDQLSEISMKLGKLKRTYRRVDQYIEAMRIVFEAWSILEKSNYIHTKDEFYKMVADGRIVSNRILMPKLKNINRYNMDVIINYISNPQLDPSHLVPKKTEKTHDSFWDEEEWDEESEEEEMQRLLSVEEAELVINRDDKPAPKMEIGYIKPKYIKGYDRRTRKKRKDENKQDKYIREGLSEILNKIQNGNYYKEQGNTFMVTNSLFETEKEEKSIYDDMKFTGSWGNEDAVELYDLIVNEEILRQMPPKEKYLTYADMQLKKFFRVLEDNNVSTIEIRRRVDGGGVNDHSAKKERIVKKENKKLESALIQRISKLNKSPKFKKIINKAEDALSKYREGE